MNVYDFDKTIYKNDSTQDFVFYTFKKYPQCFLALPKIVFYSILFGLHLMEKTKYKEKIYSYFKYLPNIDQSIEEFVQLNLHKIQPWYLARKKRDDLIISASPYFLVNAFCEKLKINHVMASKVDKKSGKYDGLNCYGEEKVKRYREFYKDDEIDEFYSDSYSDTPLARLSKKAFIVSGNKIEKWKF